MTFTHASLGVESETLLDLIFFAILVSLFFATTFATLYVFKQPIARLFGVVSFLLVVATFVFIIETDVDANPTPRTERILAEANVQRKDKVWDRVLALRPGQHVRVGDAFVVREKNDYFVGEIQ